MPEYRFVFLSWFTGHATSACLNGITEYIVNLLFVHKSLSIKGCRAIKNKRNTVRYILRRHVINRSFLRFSKAKVMFLALLRRSNFQQPCYGVREVGEYKVACYIPFNMKYCFIEFFIKFSDIPDMYVPRKIGDKLCLIG